MMAEAAESRAANPHEVPLVADALTGRDAVNLAHAFNERRSHRHRAHPRRRRRPRAARAVHARGDRQADQAHRHRREDGCARGLLSRAHCRPHPRLGDIITLVEKAAATIDAEKAARVAERMRKGAFDLGLA
jgi:signal recognition particle subunit SRP54